MADNEEQLRSSALRSKRKRTHYSGHARDEAPEEPQEEAPTSISAENVFSLFKNYLEDKLEDNKKDFEEKATLDKQVSEMKYKGNQCQFELNAKIEGILDKIKVENDGANTPVDKLVAEAKKLIRKRQKLIRIADKSKDGWKVVEEYVSDELASDTEDEKRLKKAIEVVARKRRFSKQPDERKESKRPRSTSKEAEKTLFRGKV